MTTGTNDRLFLSYFSANGRLVSSRRPRSFLSQRCPRMPLRARRRTAPLRVAPGSATESMTTGDRFVSSPRGALARSPSRRSAAPASIAANRRAPAGNFYALPSLRCVPSIPRALDVYKWTSSSSTSSSTIPGINPRVSPRVYLAGWSRALRVRLRCVRANGAGPHERGSWPRSGFEP